VPFRMTFEGAAVVASLKAGVNQLLDSALAELRTAVKEGLVAEAEQYSS
jgi:hypothetical protein